MAKKIKIMNYFYIHSHKFIFYTSLTVILFLLVFFTLPVFANEVVLNTSFSVTIPEKQSGNPGEFITYVLDLQNRSALPAELRVEYLSPSNWSVIGDTFITIPANTSNFFFPVTVLIPPDATANHEELVQIRFKLKGETFTLPKVNIPVRVNPVSSVNFDTSPTLKGTYGSTVSYKVTVSNNGNTAESFSVQSRSENSWLFTIQPSIFKLSPGEKKDIIVEHKIPLYTEIPADHLYLTFSWGSQQKLVTLTTWVTDQNEELSQQYYIWQGQFSLSHSNLNNLSSTDPNAFFSISGQWEPQGWAQFYLSDPYYDDTRTWYGNVKYRDWVIKTGEFPLSWSGLVTPATSEGTVFLTHSNDQESISLYKWNNNFGVEADYNNYSTFRLLHSSLSDVTSNIMEWNYWQNISPGLKWAHALTYNLSNSDAFGYSLNLDGSKQKLLWNTNYQYLQGFMDFNRKKIITFNLLEPPTNESITAEVFVNYESKLFNEKDPQTGELHPNLSNDYRLETSWRWPSNFNLRFVRDYHYIYNSLNADSSSVFFESNWTSGSFANEGWFNFSADNDEDTHTLYSKIYLLTTYTLNNYEDLLLNPQIVTYHPTISTNDTSKLGIGYRHRWDNGLELTSMLFNYFNSIGHHGTDLGINWRFYQHQLVFKYSGIWLQGSHTTDILSLSYNQKFSTPVQKPIGTVEGIAFIDRNHNGLMDNSESTVTKVAFLLDGKTPFSSDESGCYKITGLEPGEHHINLNSLYDVIYLTTTPEITVNVKPYQTLKIDLPLIRSQNITGIIYFDQNSNQHHDDNEPCLAGIPVILTTKTGPEPLRVYSNRYGLFTFYQLPPEPIQISVDRNLLPEDLQLPLGFMPLEISGDQLENMPPIQIGLIPYVKPIEMITPPTPKLNLSVSKELIYNNETLKILITSINSLKGLTLELPSGEVVTLNPTATQTQWSYLWKVSASLKPGQYKIIARAKTATGEDCKADVNLIILKK